MTREHRHLETIDIVRRTFACIKLKKANMGTAGVFCKNGLNPEVVSVVRIMCESSFG